MTYVYKPGYFRTVKTELGFADKEEYTGSSVFICIPFAVMLMSIFATESL